MYFQLYSLLKSCIQDGTFPRGHACPLKNSCQTSSPSHASPPNARWTNWRQKDMVERQRGKGTHVTYRYQPKPVHAPLIGMLEEIESMALNSRARVLDCDNCSHRKGCAEEFDMPPAKPLLYLARVRERNDQPFGYYTQLDGRRGKAGQPGPVSESARLKYFRDNGLADHPRETDPERSCGRHEALRRHGRGAGRALAEAGATLLQTGRRGRAA